jgi:hypothetical protein
LKEKPAVEKTPTRVYLINAYPFVQAPRQMNCEMNSMELNGNSTQKLKGISTKSNEVIIITLAKKKGQDYFTIVQYVINVVLVNN